MTVIKGVGYSSVDGFKSFMIGDVEVAAEDVAEAVKLWRGPLEAAREPVEGLPFEASDQLRYTFGGGRPLRYRLDDYWIAPGGEGPLGSTWRDKPHRIVYDLIAALVYYSRRDGGEQR
jgi:hypothetical protein